MDDYRINAQKIRGEIVESNRYLVGVHKNVDVSEKWPYNADKCYRTHKKPIQQQKKGEEKEKVDSMGNYVEFRNISKYFPGVKALDNISFKAESGFVYAFLGENGAGKSTLLKILNGDYQPDEGEYIINGEAKHFLTPKEAIAGGVSVIYQERQILMEMTVAENVFLGDWPRKKNGGIDFNRMNEKTAQVIQRFGLTGIEPDMKAGDLSIAMQQMVEIMKAVNRDSQIIAFDEPTASLSDSEITILFRIIRELQAEGKVIFYVSHRAR